MRNKVLAMFAVLSLGLAVTAFAADEAPAPAAADAAKAAPAIKYGGEIGDNIKPITLTSVDGKTTVAIDKLAKKTMFIMMSSVCTACRKEISEIGENLDKFKDKMDIYGVIIDMDATSAATRIGNLPFPVLADSEYKIGNATNLMSTPSTLIVQGGKIVYMASGYRAGQWKEYLRDPNRQ